MLTRLLELPSEQVFNRILEPHRNAKPYTPDLKPQNQKRALQGGNPNKNREAPAPHRGRRASHARCSPGGQSATTS